MRVLHVTRDFPPPGNGGLSTAVAGLVRAQLGAGLVPAVVSFDGYRPRARRTTHEPPRRDDRDGIAVLRVTSPAQLDDARAAAIALRPERIHVHHEMLWQLAAEIRRTTSAPAVVTAHTIQAEQNRLRGLDRETMSLAAQRRALAEADLVLAPSQAAAQTLLKHHPEITPRLGVARLGVDERHLAAAAAPDAAASRAVVLFAGRFADINGFADLLSAIPRVLASRPAARFVLAGGLPENRRAEQRWQRRFAASAGASARAATRFTGWLDPEALVREYAGATVLVVPSWFETFGQVLAEGMAHAVPIVATAIAATSELVADGRSALLVAPRDVDALAAAIVRLLGERELAARLGAEARAAARERTWPRMLPELLAAYESL